MYQLFATVNLGKFQTYEKARQDARKRLREVDPARRSRQPVLNLTNTGLKIVKTS